MLNITSKYTSKQCLLHSFAIIFPILTCCFVVGFVGVCSLFVFIILLKEMLF